MRMFNRLAFFLAFGALVVIVASSSATAGLFYHEEFDYADGNLVNGTNGPNAPNPPLWDDHSGTGTFVQVSGGTISTTAGSGSRQDVNLPTGSTLGQGETWYAAFDVSVTGATGEEYFAHFLQGTSNFTSRVYVTTPTAGGNYTLGITGGSNTPPVKWGTDLTYGQTYRVVVSYTLDPDNNALTQDSFSKMWIDPVSEASTSVMKVANFSNAIEGFAFRQGSVTNAGTQVIDNLCVADDFGQALRCVPEPSSLALVGLVGLGAIGMVRRRGLSC